jgi:aspartyl aminopeptidase
MTNSLIEELLTLLNQSPTAWHAMDHVRHTLLKANFTELHESEEWNLVAGKGYFLLRDGSSLCAFITPNEEITKVHLIASHTDSPGFKLKPNPEFRRENMTLLASEIYGSPLLTSWFNRELGIAGRVFFAKEDGKIGHHLVDIQDHPAIIPQLAIHLDREANEKGPQINKQEHFSALAAVDFDGQKSYVLHLLHENMKVPFDYVLSHDLFLYPLEEAKLSGSDLIAGYRLDSLASVHSCLSALKTSQPHQNRLNLAVFWNNEEIGSGTSHGAESPFLLNTLERILIAFGKTREQFLRLLPQSLCLSVDLAHAVNPNFMEKHDPRHMPLLNKGPIIKYNAQQKYSSDAHSSSVVIQLCEKHVIPYQFFVSRNDTPSGTTIGPINAAQTGIPTVDIGSPQLSMHSAREIISAQDHLEMCRLLAAFIQD